MRPAVPAGSALPAGAACPQRDEPRVAGEMPGSGPTASQLASANELSERMERAFDQLSEEHREVIALSRIVGLSHAEIAAQLGRSEGAVRMLLSRALVAYTAALDRSQQA